LKSERVLLAVLAGASFAASAVAQNTSLAINGATAGDNSAQVSVVEGTTMTFEVSNPGTPNRPYGIFGALANNGAASGWFLIASGPKRPFPVVTGVSTSLVENDYGVDIFPDRSGSPGVRLNANGDATLSLRVPTGMAGRTYFFQAVVLPAGLTSTDFSNAVEVDIVAPGSAGRLLVSQSATSVDAVQFGVLQWSGGDPRTAAFTAAAGLTNVRPDPIALGDINEWNSHFSTAADKPRDVEWRSATNRPRLNNDNHEYARVSLPALAGVDGQFGTADDVPPREMLRCFDVTAQEAFYLVINKGPNPNTPGVDFFAVPGTRKKDSLTATLNSWKAAMIVSPDGSRAAAIYDDSAAAINPAMFLFATDGSTPFLDASNNSVAMVDVTPSGTKNFNSNNNIRTSIFTDNRLWLTRDVGTTADADGRNDMTLWTVDIRASKPAPAQVTIPTNTNYPTPVIDSIPEKSLLVGRNGGTTVCFLAADTLTVNAPPAADFVQRGDWYAVEESRPTSAVNLTKFRPYGTTNTTPKILVPGEFYNGGFGFGTISPDGTRLAFVSQHSNENGATAGEDDEIYVCTTQDTDGNGEGDDASALFDNPVTTNARILSTALSNALDNSHDLFLLDSDNLFFFYGVEVSSTDRSMDLFHWKHSTATLTDVTSPTKKPPINSSGTISPEGFFLSPNFRYLYFSRGITGAGITKTNLVGIDMQRLTTFNVTGTEFPGPTTPDTTNTATFGENFNWHLSYAGGLFPSICLFSAPILSLTTSTQEWQQIWVFDANFPTAAIQLTNDQTAGNAKQNVDSLTGNPHALGCVWGWERSSSAAADVEYQDLLFFFRDVLSDTAVTFSSSLTLAGFDWIRAATSSDATGAAPPGLVCAIGDNGTDNASDAEFYYFSLNGTANYDFDDTAGVNAPGHQVGTTALSGAPFTGFVQIYFADVD
jgi:hypothetical protein